MSRKGLYTLLAVACFLGFLYLGSTYFLGDFFKSSGMHACFLKNLTGYPCPSCGTTRSVNLLYSGQPIEAFLMNPMGLIVGVLMVVLPSFLLFDSITGKSIVFNAYHKIERTLGNNRWLAIVLILLVILNWIWNINKQL